MWLGCECWLVPPTGSGCLCGFRGNQVTPLPLNREKGKVVSTGLSSSASSAVGTGTFLFFCLTSVSHGCCSLSLTGQEQRALLKHRTYPWHSAQVASFSASSTGTSAHAGTVPAAVTSVALCASWGLLQNLPFAKGNARLLGEPVALALEQKLLGFGRVLIVCKVALLELGTVS